MKRTRIIGALMLLAWSVGCSDSTPPATTYPLALAIDSQTVVRNSGIFYFKVTKNGNPLPGATLQRTDFPSNQTADLGIRSDSSGNFPRVTLVLVDTMSAVAYRAVFDSLTSNYIRWPE